MGKSKALFCLLLSILSGLLLWLGWPVKPFPFFLFVGFIPLLFIEDEISKGFYGKKGRRLLYFAFIAFLIWNVCTTYWVYNSTPAGGIFAMVANSLLMCIPVMLFFYTKKLAPKGLGYASFIIYFLAFEFFHLNWELSWPWLTLGNGFASTPSLVQFYEYTGVFGGSFWILVVNVLLFLAYKSYVGEKKKKAVILGSITILIIILPIIVSIFIYSNYKDQGREIEVVVVQPNIDPYKEKFSGSPSYIPQEKQLERLISLSVQAADSNTDYLVWPETAIPADIYEPEASRHQTIFQLTQFLKKYPHLILVSGVDSYNLYATQKTKTARKIEQGWYDTYNTAIQLDGQGKLMLYHKSKLVPGVEELPYPEVFGVLTENLGGFVGTLGKQEERSVFTGSNGVSVAPVICYESIFGDFVRKYIQNGAQSIFIITNDGWWGNTAGHRQHLAYASLRAIETRKSIARSANTGISASINQRGDILEQTEYWKQDVKKINLKVNDIKTFYTRNGDYIGEAACWLSPIFFGTALVGAFIRRKKYSK